MSEASMKTETGKSRAAKDTQGAAFLFQQFELPKFELPDEFRAATVQWVDQGKKNFDTMITATGEACGTCGKTWSTAAKCTADCTAKLTEAMHKNADAAFDLAHDLMGAKSLPELMDISTAGARRQFETLASQSQELWSLAQEAAAETMRPLTAAIPKAFQMPTAS